jgi:WD40 repeat protein
MNVREAIAVMIALLAWALLASAQENVALKLEQTIPLPEVQVRIDHLSVHVAGQRLFVSALGNGTLEVVDLKAGKPTHTISGLKEPQGALYTADKNRLFVASGKDGTVKLFNGTSFQLLKTVEYGDDADNLRYDSERDRVHVGFGGGALGEMDTDGQKMAETKSDAHPESFQLEKGSSRIYVNLPYATGGDGAISALEQRDADHYKEISRTPTVKGARTSFFSPELRRLYVAARRQGSTSALIQVFSVGQ